MGDDHPRSLPQEVCHMFGFGGFCRVYRSLISRRHSDKNRHSKDARSHPSDESRPTHKAIKALDPKDHVGRDLNGEGPQGDDLASHGGFCKDSSANNNNSYLSSSPSPLSSPFEPSWSSSPTPNLSRSGSLRSWTPTPIAAANRLLKSMSKKGVDTSSVPETGVLSRNSSQKGQFHEDGAFLKAPSIKGPSPSLSKNTSRKGPTPIMFSNSNGVLKPRAIEKNLECTLEELCFGCTKRIMITRDVVTDNGQIEEEEELLTIKVNPGWRKGTKITFEGIENKTSGTYQADIILVISEKEHHSFRREGDDLELTVEVPLLQALTGCTLPIPLLGGGELSLTMDDIIQPGEEKIIAGQGMPKLTEEGNRGNLVVKFLVEFPAQLTDEKRSEISSILQDSC
ncbi:uncharacterized protein LOC127807405 [Diospyros lotus]|uniref:uncharacterized protein LOC127807405 n=1 Tax=Diospyros lotus TaxID=55363 RepID=UPI00224F406C|nr:uncharacterized protein LOC127807405 [Diospyros lotus]